MAVITLRQIMNYEKRGKSITVPELISGLQFAKSSLIVQKSPNAIAAIDAALIALQTYQAIIAVLEQLKKLKPKLAKAAKIASIPLNPAAAQEVAQDTLIEVQTAIKEKLQEIPEKIIDTVLDYPIQF